MGEGDMLLPSSDESAWGGAVEVMKDFEEQRVLFSALDSFYQYSKTAHYNTTHLRRQSFYALPQAHWELLAAPPFCYLDTLNAVDDAIDSNSKLAMAIFKSGLESFGSTLDEGAGMPWNGTATPGDLDKARSTLRQFYRDWSIEGAPERAACYGPILEDLRVERVARGNRSMRVLVPGAGLGRLVFELCTNGFIVEGNEISYHQLLASSYILNYCPSQEIHTLYPWVHSFSNHKSRSCHLQSVQVPDIHPGTALHEKRIEGADEPGEMSMSASDFICLYEDADHKDMFDAVATVFFIDTAPNLIRYIKTVWNCLKSGGIWTNLGPLLWHFENNPPSQRGESSVNVAGIADPGNMELTDDEVIALVEKFGFAIESKELGMEAGYIQDPANMLQSTYRVSHWVARKL